MTSATASLLLGLALFLQVTPAGATHRLPLSHRTRTMQGTVSEPEKGKLSHTWKFTLLGLAGLGFLIRRRLH